MANEVVGDRGPAWLLTPGGRYGKDEPGIRPLGEELALAGNRVVIWDRPNWRVGRVLPGHHRSDWSHPRATNPARGPPDPSARLVESPWPDTEWIDASRRRARGEQAGPFERWPLLAPQLLEWPGDVLA